MYSLGRGASRRKEAMHEASVLRRIWPHHKRRSRETCCMMYGTAAAKDPVIKVTFERQILSHNLMGIWTLVRTMRIFSELHERDVLAKPGSLV
ncbi:hypothetical protein OE88DRAFT_812417 [Heliocybe sulcata]|uniref:Uncharacterized protein n=1 Tax=Heliocybe sulcata TaxID=5364 RepID=A0A5C3MP68_9AGAM|nr:hypothetical protein OE88DRAFT_812417 [Heliocybe sulcata]